MHLPRSSLGIFHFQLLFRFSKSKVFTIIIFRGKELNRNFFPFYFTLPCEFCTFANCNYKQKNSVYQYFKSFEKLRRASGFEKYQFIDDEKMIDKAQNLNNVMLITTPNNYPKNARKVDTIYFLDGSVAFDIVEL